jgi:hypothetical protein
MTDIERTTSTINTEKLSTFLTAHAYPSLSSISMMNRTTFTGHGDDTILIKLIDASLISLADLVETIEACQCNGHVLDEPFDQFHVVVIQTNTLSSIDALGQFLARWRLHTRTRTSIETMPNDEHWWHRYFAAILEQKKPHFPFLLANLYTCQAQLAGSHFERGLQWNDADISFYLLDVAAVLIADQSNWSDLRRGYEEILPLTNDEINHLETFVRLHLIMALVDQTLDEDKALERLEQCSSNLFFMRECCRET